MASCPYFEAMFSTEMTEEQSGLVDFTLYSKEAIDSVVKYLYTAELPAKNSSYNMLKELIQVSHLMQIEKFLLHCWKEITTITISTTTFPEIWQMAGTFRLDNHEIINYCSQNIENISKYGEFGSFDISEMERFISSVNRVKGPSSFLVECVFKWKEERGSEEDALKLLKKIDMGGLSNNDLVNFVKTNCVMSENNIGSVFVNEAVRRLARDDN